MPPTQAVHIIGCGAVTAVGTRSAVSMAAVQAGLSRMRLVPEDADPDDDDVVTNVSHITTLSTEEPAARARELLRLAIEEAMSPLLGRAPGPLGAWTVGPPLLDARQVATQVAAEKHRIVPVAVEAAGDQGSAALCAVERAARKLIAGEIELALISGFDVRTGEKAVAKATAEGRTIGPGRSWGYVPGEASAAILLANDRGLQRLAVPSQSTLVAVSSASEPNPPGTATPCLGRGITDAVRKVLALLPINERVARVLCDLNGDRGRTDEWGFTLPRVAGRLADPGAFLAPAMAWGDCGSPNGLLLLALAVALNRRDGGGASHTLVWTSSDGNERAAALVRAEPPSARKNSEIGGLSQDAPPVSPAWAEELDRGILTEMAEECCFRYQQRGFQLSKPDNEEVRKDWRHIERTEECTDNLALGLSECGPLAQRIAQSAVPSNGPGAVYTAIRTVLEAGNHRQAIAIAAEHVASDSSMEEPALQAFQHALRSSLRRDDIASDLFSAGPALAWLALEFAVSMGRPVPVAKLHELAGGVSQDRVLNFVTALGRSGDPNASAYLSRWCNSPDPLVRREAALADILIGRAAAGVRVLQNVQHDDAVLLPAALVVDLHRAPQLLARAKAAKGPEPADPILAMAVAGDHAAIPWLLERLQDETTAAIAACALELLLGATLLEIYDAPDEDGLAPPQKAQRVSRNRADWAHVATCRALEHLCHLRSNGDDARSA
jgi:3-oxoacyl-[acyl-carrier-protein] synthase-1